MKVLIVAHVGETLGHLVRAISVAEKLSSLGVSVLIASSAQAHKVLHERLAGSKIGFRDVQWSWSHNAHSAQAPSAYHQLIEQSNRNLLQLLDNERPDLLLSFPGVFTAQAARSRDIPHISVLHGPYVSPILDRQRFDRIERVVLDFVSELMIGGLWDSIFVHLSRSLNLPRMTYDSFLKQELIVVAQPGLDLPPLQNMVQCGFILGSYGSTEDLPLSRGTCYVTF